MPILGEEAYQALIPAGIAFTIGAGAAKYYINDYLWKIHKTSIGQLTKKQLGDLKRKLVKLRESKVPMRRHLM
jgi:hypothetical protein